MSELNLKMRPLTLALACVALLTVPAFAAPAKDDTLRLLEAMNARLEQLEQRNAELEKQLKAVEKEVQSTKNATQKIDALDGLSAGVSLTTIAQRPRGLPQGLADASSQLNYRADVTVELPLAPIGDIEQKVFAHFRLGQGQGLNAPISALGAFASAPNALAFQASGASADDSVAILGQAWYQASIPLPFGGFKPQSREKLELTFGKIDLFGFFDQNAVAGDEGRQFLNSAFVHNPLLDAGGQVGVDANGFQPGLIASYLNETSNPETWRLSLGVFGAGEKGANYQRSLSSPLIMAQAEISRKFFGGLTGNYRAYAWQRSQALELDGVTEARQSGWGLSVDQRVGNSLTLFGRYGQQIRGKVRFDRALTLGGEINGDYWSRGGDSLGIATGWFRASNEFRAQGGELDMDGDGVVDFSYAPDGSERLTEIYYRYRISKQFELSPNFQYLARLGGNSGIGSVKILGLRAQLAF